MIPPPPLALHLGERRSGDRIKSARRSDVLSLGDDPLHRSRCTSPVECMMMVLCPFSLGYCDLQRKIAIMPTVLITGLTGFVSPPRIQFPDHCCRSVPDSLGTGRGKQSDYCTVEYSRVLILKIALHIADRFLSAGYNVRGTVRSKEKGEHVLSLPAFQEARADGRLEYSVVEDVITGDYTRAMKGVDVVLHAASPVNM